MSTTALHQQPEPAHPDYQAIKFKQQAAWGSGDYGKIGITLQITGEQLCEAMDIRPGSRVLDVAAGNGNASLAAARRFCNVVSTDYVDTLLQQGKTRASAEGMPITFKQADAENLPFEDGSFDYVMSTFGVMFAPDQSTSAAELARVCRPGGRIGMANWTPGGFIGQLFKTIGQHVPPPSGVSSPALWGTTEFLSRHFPESRHHIESRARFFNFRYQSPQHWLDLFRTYYGPVHKAFETLNEEKSRHLESDLLELIDRMNQAQDGTMLVPSEYLEIVVTSKT